MSISNIRDNKFVTGTNQTLKAIEKGEALKVYVAKDSSEYLFDKIESACINNSVDFETVLSMQELGNYCGISRNAVCAAIIK